VLFMTASEIVANQAAFYSEYNWFHM